MFTNPVTEKLAAFVRSIGIHVRAARLDEPTFLPGVESPESPRQGQHLLRSFHHGNIYHRALIRHCRSPLALRVLHGC